MTLADEVPFDHAEWARKRAQEMANAINKRALEKRGCELIGGPGRRLHAQQVDDAAARAHWDLIAMSPWVISATFRNLQRLMHRFSRTIGIKIPLAQTTKVNVMISKASKNHLSDLFNLAHLLKAATAIGPTAPDERPPRADHEHRPHAARHHQSNHCLGTGQGAQRTGRDPGAGAHADHSPTATPHGRTSTRVLIMKKSLYAAVLFLAGCKGDFLQGIDFSQLNCPAPNASEVSTGPSTSEELSKAASLPIDTF
jgi:hypothetical protein